MAWKFKNFNKINSNSNVSCEIDEIIETLSKEYKIDKKTLSNVVIDIIIKYMTEHKMTLEDIRKKYSDLPEIENIIAKVLDISYRNK